MVELKEASGILDRIQAEGPVDHISDHDAQLLREVVDLVEKSIYLSMDNSHASDEAELAAAVGVAAACNSGINLRQAPGGDLGFLFQQVQDRQTELDRLQGDVEAYNLTKSVRDTQYCDWKVELTAACEAFERCFNDASDHYTTSVPRIASDMNRRIEVYRAGETLVHQIRFLLGEVDDQTTPAVNTSRYELSFPELPAKGLCDLGPLNSDEWVPPVTCTAPVCSGSTGKGTTNWGSASAHSADGIWVDVETKDYCQWSATPIYVTRLGGRIGHWLSSGGSLQVHIFPRGFRIYVYLDMIHGGITPAMAKEWELYVIWEGHAEV